MIKAVGIIDEQGDVLYIELEHPERSGFNITDITGIDGGDADINTTQLTTVDGSKYNSARRRERNIVLKMKYYDSPELEIETIRHLSYKFFKVKSHIGLVFYTDERDSFISGYVESNDVKIFKEEESCQVSIICPNPYFQELGLTQVTTFSGVDAAFEFPFGNEDLYEPELIFGEIRSIFDSVIPYYGDADTGVVIKIRTMSSNVNGINIYNTETREEMHINTSEIQNITGSPFSSGDEIIINTNKGEKSLTLVRSGGYYDILNAIDKDSDWFTLAYGDNVFAFTVDSGIKENLIISIENNVLYEGV